MSFLNSGVDENPSVFAAVGKRDINSHCNLLLQNKENRMKPVQTREVKIFLWVVSDTAGKSGWFHSIFPTPLILKKKKKNLFRQLLNAETLSRWLLAGAYMHQPTCMVVGCCIDTLLSKEGKEASRLAGWSQMCKVAKTQCHHRHMANIL